MSGSPLTSFHLEEASIPAFSWFYSLHAQLPKNIKKCLLFKIFHIFSTHIAINLLYFAQLENVSKLWNDNRPVHVNERSQNKSKTKSRHIQIDHGFYCWLYPKNNALVSLNIVYRKKEWPGKEPQIRWNVRVYFSCVTGSKQTHKKNWRLFVTISFWSSLAMYSFRKNYSLSLCKNNKTVLLTTNL